LLPYYKGMFLTIETIDKVMPHAVRVLTDFIRELEHKAHKLHNSHTAGKTQKVDELVREVKNYRHLFEYIKQNPAELDEVLDEFPKTIKTKILGKEPKLKRGGTKSPLQQVADEIEKGTFVKKMGIEDFVDKICEEAGVPKRKWGIIQEIVKKHPEWKIDDIVEYVAKVAITLRKIKGSAMPPESLFFKSAKQSYKAVPEQILDGFQLVQNTPTFKAYKNGNVILIGLRGTDIADKEDLVADASLPFNRLTKTARYRKDKMTLEKLAMRFPPQDNEYYLSGHSLSGAIINQLKYDFPFLRNAVEYNPAFQVKDLIWSQKPDIKRIYTDKDGLYRLGGKLFQKNVVIPAQNSTGVDAIDAVSGHILSNFQTLYSGSGTTSSKAKRHIPTEPLTYNEFVDMFEKTFSPPPVVDTYGINVNIRRNHRNPSLRHPDLRLNPHTINQFMNWMLSRFNQEQMTHLMPQVREWYNNRDSGMFVNILNSLPGQPKTRRFAPPRVTYEFPEEPLEVESVQEVEVPTIEPHPAPMPTQTQPVGRRAEYMEAEQRALEKGHLTHYRGGKRKAKGGADRPRRSSFYIAPPPHPAPEQLFPIPSAPPEEDFPEIALNYNRLPRPSAPRQNPPPPRRVSAVVPPHFQPATPSRPLPPPRIYAENPVYEDPMPLEMLPKPRSRPPNRRDSDPKPLVPTPKSSPTTKKTGGSKMSGFVKMLYAKRVLRKKHTDYTPPVRDKSAPAKFLKNKIKKPSKHLQNLLGAVPGLKSVRKQPNPLNRPFKAGERKNLTEEQLTELRKLEAARKRKSVENKRLNAWEKLTKSQQEQLLQESKGNLKKAQNKAVKLGL